MALAFLLNPNSYLLMFLLLGAINTPSPLVSPAMQTINKQENSILTQAIMKQEMNQVAGQKNSATSNGSSNDIMIVDAKEMAKDWKSAFVMLKNKQTASLFFKLSNGDMVKDIVDLDPLPGGYLMFFTLKTLHGMQYKIIKTSEIESIETL